MTEKKRSSSPSTWLSNRALSCSAVAMSGLGDAGVQDWSLDKASCRSTIRLFSAMSSGAIRTRVAEAGQLSDAIRREYSHLQPAYTDAVTPAQNGTSASCSGVYRAGRGGRRRSERRASLCWASSSRVNASVLSSVAEASCSRTIPGRQDSLALAGGPRTEWAGFTSSTWPVTSQSNQCLPALLDRGE